MNCRHRSRSRTRPGDHVRICGNQCGSCGAAGEPQRPHSATELTSGSAASRATALARNRRRWGGVHKRVSRLAALAPPPAVASLPVRSRPVAEDLWTDVAHTYARSFAGLCAGAIPEILADLPSRARLLDVGCG